MGPSPATSGPPASASAVVPSRVDVVVIGAGISGLVAAGALHRQQHAVAVLEARSRVGGRLLCTPGGANLGGSWSWEGDVHVKALAARLGAVQLRQRLDGEALLKRGGQVREIGNVGAQIAPCGPGATRVAGGYATLCERLAAELPPGAVRLGCAAARVEHDAAAGLLRVHSAAAPGGPEQPRVVEARRVIVAVPPRVAGALEFEPPLPEEQARAMRGTPTWCGDWAKVVATFRTPFWRGRGRSGAAATQDADDLAASWWEEAGDDSAGEPGGAALVGLAFGDAGARLGAYATRPDGSSGDELRARVVRELTALFGDDVAAELSAVHHKAWVLDPLTYGPPPPPEARLARPSADPRGAYGNPRLRRPLEWGVHWAGTETEAQSGHVEGAIIAGERTAREVAAGLAAAAAAAAAE